MDSGKNLKFDLLSSSIINFQVKFRYSSIRFIHDSNSLDHHHRCQCLKRSNQVTPIQRQTRKVQGLPDIMRQLHPQEVERLRRIRQPLGLNQGCVGQRQVFLLLLLFRLDGLAVQHGKKSDGDYGGKVFYITRLFDHYGRGVHYVLVFVYV